MNNWQKPVCRSLDLCVAVIILGATNESQQIEPHSFVFLLTQQPPPLLPRRGGVVSQKKPMLSLDTFQALNHTPIQQLVVAQTVY